MEKVIVVVGPTAVGKTALSIELAKKYQGEVISGDSMQIYRGLDIGTAKVTAAEMQGIPHHLIDIRDSHESYSVAEFQKEARELITATHQRGHLPIVAGGTGLYIQALLYDYQLGAAEESDPSVRQRYQQEAARIGIMTHISPHNYAIYCIIKLLKYTSYQKDRKSTRLNSSHRL